jgi:hypothetical protein
VLEQNPASSQKDKSDASSLRLQAALAREELADINGLNIALGDQDPDTEAVDKTYDMLVCGYYR